MNEIRVERVSEDSVERLFIVDSLRDYLNKNSEELLQMGVAEVIAFGSVVRGEAKDTSDTDINFMIPYIGGYEADVDYMQKEPKIKEFLKKYLRDNNLRERKDIHAFVSHMKQDGTYPDHIEDKLTIWSST